MKKTILLAIFFAVFSVFFGAGYTYASASKKIKNEAGGMDIQRQMEAFAGEDGAEYGQPADIRVVVARIIKIFLSIVGTLAVAYTMYGGYLYMTSGGAEERISRARKIILYGALGSMVILMSYSFAYFAYFIAYKGTAGNPYGGYFDWGVSVQDDTSQFYNTDPLEQSTVPDNFQLQNILHD
ncbi:hypothetical protein C0581_04020 [Candidatus Parcubacteria bacterium]|nr:MAG: hypothetical protein C0581_04020 [Candidatus Parcubacteria bacterium]